MQILSLGLLFGIMIGVGGSRWQNKNQNQATEANLEKYQALEIVDQLLWEEYYDKQALLSGKNKMMQEAIKGYVNGLEDPHTAFLDREEFS